jgi:uncharacterized protein
MSDIFYFDEDQPLEIRDLEQRIVGGRIVPYNEVIQVRGKPESFTRGALQDVNPNSVKLLRDHDRSRPLGKMVALEERADGAHAEFRVSKTRAGDEALELARDGVLGFSVGFHPGEQTQQGVHTRLRSLPETSLVTFSHYTGAEVLSVRQQKEAPVPETEETVIDAGGSDVVIDLAPMEQRMDGFQSSLDRLQALAEAPDIRSLPVGGPTPLDWFAAQVEAIGGRSHQRREKLAEDWSNFQTRMANGDVPIETRFLYEDQWETRQSSLEDVTGDFPGASPIVDASGLVVEQYVSSQLVNVLDTRRPLLTRLGRFPGPRSGYAQLPVVTQHTEVGARTGQKTEAHSRKLIIVKQSFEAVWYDGAVDVALELIRSSEINVLDFIWTDLLGQFAIVTESALVEAIDASTAWTEEGAVLTLTNYGTFINDVATQALVVQRNSGAPATRLAVTEAQWPTILGLTDGIGRRVFATNGPTNADGAAPINAQSIELAGGIEVFPVPGLADAILFNGESLRVSDYGVERVEALNVAEMGVDLGLLGRIMFVPRIPAGVVVFSA